LIDLDQHSQFAAGIGDEASSDGASAADAAVRPASVSILLVEDDWVVARDLEETLTRLGYRVCGMASEGAEAIAMADTLKPEMIVMDVGLHGDLDGIQTAQLILERIRLPIIFLTGHRDAETLHRAVLIGPLGYLVKPFQEAELHGAIEIAIYKHNAERKRQEREAALRRYAEHHLTLSLADELTGLRNRRGFFELAHQALKLAKREQHALTLFFMDVNGLKQINDSLGHSAGDQALRDAATVLRHTFRDSDILARIGGDEFVVLAQIHDSQDAHSLNERLHHQLAAHNTAGAGAYTLDISIGMTLIAPGAAADLETLIANADEAMYQEKRGLRERALANTVNPVKTS
jgi:diguanylate cyclase (GGDEF)-like protein